jgi:hypothetical protein
MTVDYGRALEFGISVVPEAAALEEVRAAVGAADRSGLDLVGIQDHPYQRRFLDTLALIGTLLAETRRVRVFPDVANLPLRPPATLAKEAASLDVLSGGRFELGLGAGAFWDAIEAMAARGGRLPRPSRPSRKPSRSSGRHGARSGRCGSTAGTTRSAATIPGRLPRTGSRSGSAPTSRGCCG